MGWILGKLTGVLGRAATPLLAKLALAVLALVLSLSGALVFQTWRVANLSERVAELRFGVGQCVEANKAAVGVIERQRQAMEANARQRALEFERQRQAAEQLRQMQREVENRANAQIRIIERTVDDCADRDVPDDIRLLLDGSQA